jgi:hypothetical protein
MNTWLYAALCVVVPVAWGMLIVALSNSLEHVIASRLERRSAPHPPEPNQPESKRRTLPPIDYHI